jgi:hypothetical protein
MVKKFGERDVEIMTSSTKTNRSENFFNLGSSGK